MTEKQKIVAAVLLLVVSALLILFSHSQGYEDGRNAIVESSNTDYIVIVDDNQYDTVTANSFIIDDMGSLIFIRDKKNYNAYSCGYWTRVFEKNSANIIEEEIDDNEIVEK